MSLKPSPSGHNRSRFRPKHRGVTLVGRKTPVAGDRGGIRLALDVVFALALFVTSLTINLGAVETQGFHPDETRWLNRSYYIEDVLDPFGPTWQDYYLTRGQPPMGSYLMGIGQLVQGKSLRPNLVWDFYFDSNDPVFPSSNPSERWNQISGAMPSREDLMAGRRTNAFTGALVVMVVYVLGRLLTNRVGGIIGALALAIHPLHELIASQALSDQLLNLLLALSCIAGYLVMKRPTWGRALVFGALLGLGGATKLTPMLLSLPVAIMGAFFLIRGRFWNAPPVSRQKDRTLGTKLIIQPVIAFATFVIVYPYLWVDPIGRTYNLFKFRVDEMASQAALFENAGVGSIQAGLGRTGNRLADMHQAGTEVLNQINDVFGTSLSVSGIDMMLGFAGILLFVMLVVRNGLRSPHTMVAALILAEAATIIYGLRSDLYRYFLPLVFVQAVCISVLAGVIWSTVFGPRVRRLVGSSALDRFLLPRDAGRITAGVPWAAPGSAPPSRPTRVRIPRPALGSSQAD